MTQNEIIEMAREAGFKMENSAAIQAAEIFANLVAAKEQKKWQDQTAVEIYEAVLEEREACMNVLRGLNYANSSKYDCMDAIRARGEA